MQDAKEIRTECKVQCDEDFVISRDLCRNIDPECAATCRGAHGECRDAIFAALDQCVDGCRVQLNVDRAGCPRRGRGRDFCMDRAQVRAFICRDECREDLHVRPGLSACRDDFRSCMAGCVVTEPEPTAVPTAVATAVPTAVPTVVPTETPPPVATETPVPTRTATPKPQPTLTPVVPR